jgi:2-methylfumaryl-CoA hydratase
MTVRSGNFFEDFRLGQRMRHATPRTVGEGDGALYIALTGSRHILASSRPVAHSLGYRDRPLDDLLAFHIAFGKTVHDISLNAVANLGYADARFIAPVYAGDTLRAESEVIGLKQNSNAKTGVVWVRSRALNQNSQPVIEWVRWVMVHKRDAAAPAPATHVPQLPAFVPSAELAVPAGYDASGFDTANTGSDRLWDDYAPGARIDHPAGMTIDDADHTLATRLYQNDARVHFDALAMQQSQFGRRLMYGGHVMSVCRALSYEGLENALSICAINGGSHTAPSFGGDTVFALSEVLDKWPLPGRRDIGALRLRLAGIKNLPAAAVTAVRDAAGAYHPNVVLDLDYTVLMPRQPRKPRKP